MCVRSRNFEADAIQAEAHLVRFELLLLEGIYLRLCRTQRTKGTAHDDTVLKIIAAAVELVKGSGQPSEDDACHMHAKLFSRLEPRTLSHGRGGACRDFVYALTHRGMVSSQAAASYGPSQVMRTTMG